MGSEITTLLTEEQKRQNMATCENICLTILGEMCLSQPAKHFTFWSSEKQNNSDSDCYIKVNWQANKVGFHARIQCATLFLRQPQCQTRSSRNSDRNLYPEKDNKEVICHSCYFHLNIWVCIKTSKKSREKSF